jgi:hypothetical protein
MKKFRIKPGIYLTTKIWILEQKVKFKWKEVAKHESLRNIKDIKDHLLIPIKEYTEKNNISEAGKTVSTDVKV